MIEQSFSSRKVCGDTVKDPLHVSVCVQEARFETKDGRLSVYLGCSLLRLHMASRLCLVLLTAVGVCTNP